MNMGKQKPQPQVYQPAIKEYWSLKHVVIVNWVRFLCLATSVGIMLFIWWCVAQTYPSAGG